MAELSRCIIHGLRILIEEEWVEEHAVVIENGIIAAIVNKEDIQQFMPAHCYAFSPHYSLIPGLIDMHIHGANGSDVMDADVEALTNISMTLAAEGVTGFLATTMTASHQRIELALRSVAEARACQAGAAILGVHLEGPFISALKVGAQSSQAVEIPNPTILRHWQTVAQGAIKLVTLAPELPEAQSLIEALSAMGIIASVGHTNASYGETCVAIEAGCSHATHLFNAMRGMHQREPGAVGALLLAQAVNTELIVDGMHLHPAIVELAYRLKGREKIVLVTDAMRAKCLGDGDYDLGGQVVTVQARRASLMDGTLAGSTLRMPQAIKNMVEYSQCTLAEAISMASYNPARILNLSQRKGSIAPGKDADVVVMNADFDVVMTMCQGRVVYTSRTDKCRVD